MKSVLIKYGRLALPLVLAGALAACETVPPGSQASSSQPQTTDSQPGSTGQTTQQPEGQQPGANTRQPAPVAVYLADTAEQQGWTKVPVQSGVLYVNPQPILTRDDLTGVEPGRASSGQGVLALVLNADARQRLLQISTQNPNKRLALVVGRTMLSVPSYNAPVDTEKLVFPVGTEQNAVAAAMAIAGQEAP
jgi:preprotein translocase subunit SecD